MSSDEPENSTAADEADRVAAYDLDGDGKISLAEDARANLGLVDARLEQLAEKPGIVGRIADAAHHVVDAIDND